MTKFPRLVWTSADHGEAEYNGWRYAIQSEQVRGEPRYYSLMIKAPGTQVYVPVDGHRDSFDPPVPDIPSRSEGTKEYVRRLAQAQAHADEVTRRALR